MAHRSRRLTKTRDRPLTEPRRRVLEFVVPKMEKPLSVHGTKLHPADPSEDYRQKLARIALGEMLEFVSVLTVEGTLLECSRRALEAAGLTHADVVGKPFWETHWWTTSPRAKSDLRAAVLRAAGGERTECEAEVFRRKGSPETTFLHVTLLPVRDDDGRVVLLVSEGREITEMRARDLELAEHRRKLAQLCAELSDQDRLKDEFLATLAHELRNPLAPIRTGVHVLRRAGNNPALLEKVSLIMERQLEQMVRLVDDLLDVSRISRNKLELRRSRVDLSAVVESALEMSRPAVDAASHELDVVLPPTPIELDADAVRLAQVFSNLLDNAAKYTAPGGRIWFSAETRDSAGKREVVVRVRDTGVGISADKLPHIFEMFVQAAPAFDRSQGGLGIGLTLAQRLVGMHGGTLKAFSDGAGKGSEFVIHLPVTTELGDVPAHAGRDSEQKSERLRHRILVVDDNRDSAEMLATMLQVWGHEVTLAHDGLKALERGEALLPRVAFLDIGMPVLNGYETARRIRRSTWGKGMTLVAVTGLGHEDDKRRSREAGFDAHLVKPVDLTDIEQLLGALNAPERGA
ncbi:MAG TPA: ATP-binding protein [Polyangiaceae bacterium]